MKPRTKPVTRHQAPPRTAEVDGSVGERVEIYSRLGLAQQRYDDVIATSRSDQHGHARGAGATRAEQTGALGEPGPGT
jgi:hypothetical protein